MAQFEVKLLTKEGEIETKVIEAVTKTALYEQVRQEGHRLVSSKELNKAGLQDLIDKINNFLGKVKLQDRITFARNIAAMLAAGLALSRAISIMERQTKNIKFKTILQDLNEEIGKGATFSSALAKYPKVFSNLFVSRRFASAWWNWRGMK